ncbi:MAG: hypothetical protein HYT98_02515 [Candidatus Sungbacteria bacterium]|nr:hypothetical protein [Candidatus Sungbacteria bacterium]
MSKISVEQGFTMLAKLGEHIDWDSLTTEQVQVGVREAPRAGVEATVFIRNGFRVLINDFFRETGEVSIQIPALPRPTLAGLREKYSWIRKEDSIELDTSPTESVTLVLGTVLLPDELRIDGIEYELRRTSLAGRMFGYQQLEWLVEHQDEHPVLKALLGKIYIDGCGLVVVRADGRRRFPCLDRGGGRWCLRWDWVGGDLARNGRLAVSGKK